MTRFFALISALTMLLPLSLSMAETAPDSDTVETVQITLTDLEPVIRFEDGEIIEEAVSDSVVDISQIEAMHDAYEMTPDASASVKCSHADCTWKLPMGCTDEDAVWRALMQPVTVISGDQRKQYKVRKRAEADCNLYTGSVTCESQAVHVLSTSDDGKWTLIGAYSTCEADSRIAVFAKYFEGWVETSRLQTKEVSQKYAIVIDKLTQRLHVYKEGKLFTTLLCSTGYVRDEAYWQETPAGDFLTVSWVGGFWSGSLWCEMGIRINDGILLHQVPVLITENSDGTKTENFDRCERFLGEKASHGCIRIQRQLSPEGVNQKWLWDNLERNNTRVLIWDDHGRTLEGPADTLKLYYNSNGGKLYHGSPVCAEVNKRFWPLSAFEYGQLDQQPYSKLKPCSACAPAPTAAEIRKYNKEASRKK